MKTGQIFWGTFFVVLGALIFLVRFDILDISWTFVWDLWPFVFIFWGLMVIAKDSKIKPVITMLFGLFFALSAYGIVMNVIFEDVFFDEDEKHITQFYTKEFDSTITHANLEVDGGVGSFFIKNSTTDLLKATAKGNMAEYEFYTRVEDSTAWIDCNLDDQIITVFPTKISNQLDIKLNKNPIWDLILNFGAAKAKFDLSKFKVKNILLNTGATNTKIKLGELYPMTEVEINMGGTSLTIDVPKNSGCKLKGDMVLVAKDLDQFIKQDSDYYITENYEEAENKIIIKVDGGVSSLSINRY